MALNAGQLDQRVTLQARVAGVDARGQGTETWADLATVWAQVTPLRGREYFAAGQTQTPADVRMRLRYRADVTPAHRVVWRGVPHDIVSVADMMAGAEMLELLCVAGVKDGR